MSRLILAAGALFLTAILPLAARAADQPAPDRSAVVQSGPPAPSAAANATSPPNPQAPLGAAANPLPKDYPVPASQADKLLPADPGVVTNGPVPDTPANRARDGQPLSNGGRATQPAGN